MLSVVTRRSVQPFVRPSGSTRTTFGTIRRRAAGSASAASTFSQLALVITLTDTVPSSP